MASEAPAGYDIVPDIHGDLGRLTGTLAALGYAPSGGVWRHPQGRRAAFLGDFIDGGRQNAAVIDTVRAMVGAGAAVAIMGNHELNAILYHTEGPRGPLRPHTAKNTAQHESFLAEFPPGRGAARGVLDWFLTLPVFLDLAGFRLVHACWDEDRIARIRSQRPDGRLRPDDLPALAEEAAPGPLAEAVLTSLKGPEIDLPEGVAFHDLGGHRRTRMRVKWWRSEAASWAEAALSVPDPSALPDGPVGAAAPVRFYDAGAAPVFFGHYKRLGRPALDAPNALCLDYPAAPCAYRWDGERVLRPDRLMTLRS